MNSLNSPSSFRSIFLTAVVAFRLTAGISAWAQEAGIPPSETERVSSTPTDAEAATKTMPPGWNGNLCQPDSMRVCLGTEGIGRDNWVKCMRAHYDQLTPDCQEVMAPGNFKHPLQAEETPPAKAAPGLFNH
jgi:ABC-type dipeptide/oligopeptide/nickel transport system permease subunit